MFHSGQLLTIVYRSISRDRSIVHLRPVLETDSFGSEITCFRGTGSKTIGKMMYLPVYKLNLHYKLIIPLLKIPDFYESFLFKTCFSINIRTSQDKEKGEVKF